MMSVSVYAVSVSEIHRYMIQQFSDMKSASYKKYLQAHYTVRAKMNMCQCEWLLMNQYVCESSWKNLKESKYFCV